MVYFVTLLTISFLLDLLLGDPMFLYHPVQGIGLLISGTEKVLWKVFRLSEKPEEGKVGKRLAGVLEVFTVLLITGGIYFGIYFALGLLSPIAAYVFALFTAYRMIALKSLTNAAMKVYSALLVGIKEGREAVAMIVGRDTQKLSREGVIKACVETVAENTSDGIIAPLFYLCLGGLIGHLCLGGTIGHMCDSLVSGWKYTECGMGMIFIVIYKAVNTMDSMIGYKNDRYQFFGTAAAKLDDVLNFIPARVGAVLMICAAFFCGFDAKNAAIIFKRDRYCHKSPNSAQCESVVAGALGIQLAGDASYFGKVVKKPTIGDSKRAVQMEDIGRSCRMAMICSMLFLILSMTILFMVSVVV